MICTTAAPTGAGVGPALSPMRGARAPAAAAGVVRAPRLCPPILEARAGFLLLWAGRAPLVEAPQGWMEALLMLAAQRLAVQR